jgi:hypothetical protein
MKGFHISGKRACFFEKNPDFTRVSVFHETSQEASEASSHLNTGQQSN